MMKDGADMLISFGAKNDIYDVYETLAKNPKWALYKTDVNRFISPYHHMADPEKTLNEMLTTIGFKNIRIDYKLKTYYFYDFDKLRRKINIFCQMR